MRLILASASPRRQDLVARLGLPFQAVAPDIDEDAATGAGRPEQIARRLALAKAVAVARHHPRAIVLAADTVVAQRGTLLSKPPDARAAEAMLKRLRGRLHRVITAVAVVKGKRRWIDHVVTRVRMRHYSDAEVAASIARGDPFDKAGGYAIQDEKFRPVASYEGCYCNVVGLPLWTALRLLSEAGMSVSSVAADRLLPQCRECPARQGPP